MRSADPVGSMFPLLLVGAVVLVPLIWFFVTYNGFIKLRNLCKESWSNIDTELKRRYELIPNLVATCKGYAQFEQSVLTQVVEARSRAVASTGSPASQARDENSLVKSLRQMIALAEGYPDLKANQQYLQLMIELRNTEDRIQAARRFYNANVRDLNVMVDSIPSNLVAGMFKFQKAEFFEIEDALQRVAPNVQF